MGLFCPVVIVGEISVKSPWNNYCEVFFVCVVKCVCADKIYCVDKIVRVEILEDFGLWSLTMNNVNSKACIILTTPIK